MFLLRKVDQRALVAKAGSDLSRTRNVRAGKVLGEWDGRHLHLDFAEAGPADERGHRAGNDPEINYDHGVHRVWFIAPLDGTRFFYKEGGGGGFYCMMRVYPGDGIGTVVMTNATGFDVRRLLDTIDASFVRSGHAPP